MSTPPTFEQIEPILSATTSPRGLTLREIAAALGIQGRNLRELREVTRQAVRRGRMIRLGRNRYALAPPVRLVRGKIHIARGGFGFVHPDPETDPSGDPHDDTVVFVPRRELMGALHGDSVLARVTEEKSDGRLEGTIEKILQRAHETVIGIWESERGSADRRGWVRPLDTRVSLRIGVTAPRPVDSGTVVEVKVHSFPSFGDGPASGELSHVIGPVDDPRFDVAIVCRKYSLTEQFPREVTRDVEGKPDEVRDEDRADRHDFRQEMAFTIDPESAKDFDDAIAVERREGGGYRATVHIADVSHYVPEGGPTDLEAARRGTSVYFPGFVVPMLPHPLSSGICSLKPGVDRLVVSAIMDLSEQGELQGARFVRGVIRSAARLTYPEAQRILDGDPEVRDRRPDLVEPLLLAEELARVLRRGRQQRGSIDFDLPEAEILWTLEGEMAGIVAADSSFSHKVIEELMLLANEAVARRLTQPDHTSIYRVHERPDPAKLENLSEELRALGYRLEGDFLNPKPRMFQNLVARAQGRPEERIVSTLALRAMMLARYDVEPLGHFGLAAPLYTHFTSPIRRYPDLVIHRLLLESEGLVEPRRRDLRAISRHSSERERIAQDAEREVLDIKKMRFMHDRLGEEFDGIVLSVDRNGAWVELIEYLIDGLVPLDSLRDDVYEHLPTRRSLVGTLRGRRLKIGDHVRVRVERVDLARRFIDFAVVWTEGEPPAERPSRKAVRKARQERKRARSRKATPGSRAPGPRAASARRRRRR